MDFKDRLDMYVEGGMITQSDVEDVNAVIKLFKDNYGIELTEDKDSKKLFASVRLAKVDDVELAKLSGYNKKLDKVMENVTKVLNEIEEELKNITKEEIK